MALTDVIELLRGLRAKLKQHSLPDGRDPDLLFSAVVEAANLVANADGSFDARERELLKELVRALDEPDLEGEHLDEMLHDLDELHKTEGLDVRCAAIGKTLLECDAVEDGIYLAATIAYASMSLAREELRVLEKIGSAARLSTADLAALATSARSDLEAKSGAARAV